MVRQVSQVCLLKSGPKQMDSLVKTLNVLSGAAFGVLALRVVEACISPPLQNKTTLALARLMMATSTSMASHGMPPLEMPISTLTVPQRVRKPVLRIYLELTHHRQTTRSRLVDASVAVRLSKGGSTRPWCGILPVSPPTSPPLISPPKPPSSSPSVIGKAPPARSGTPISITSPKTSPAPPQPLSPSAPPPR